tara:strand:- start:45 stop:443 length:399 start_codon:yes stop_codon:yes gene_type:complete
MSVIQSLITPVSDLLGKVIPDADERNRLAHEIATMSEKAANENALQQIELNKLDAKGNWFQSSWRPLAGYVSVIAMGWHFVGQPVATFIIAAAGFDLPELPTFDMSTLMTVLLGMLGMGGLRSWDKRNGTAK